MKIIGVKFKNYDRVLYNSKMYRYKSLDDTVNVGDYVIVDTPNTGFEIAQVVIILNDSTVNATKHIVCKVEMDAYNELLEKEKRLKELSAKFEDMLKKVDELEKYKALVDKGLISEEEYKAYTDLMKESK